MFGATQVFFKHLITSSKLLAKLGSIHHQECNHSSVDAVQQDHGSKPPFFPQRTRATVVGTGRTPYRPFPCTLNIEGDRRESANEVYTASQARCHFYSRCPINTAWYVPTCTGRTQTKAITSRCLCSWISAPESRGGPRNEPLHEQKTGGTTGRERSLALAVWYPKFQSRSWVKIYPTTHLKKCLRLVLDIQKKMSRRSSEEVQKKFRKSSEEV